MQEEKLRDIERRYTYELFTSRQPVKSEANDAMTGIVSQVAIKKWKIIDQQGKAKGPVKTACRRGKQRQQTTESWVYVTLLCRYLPHKLS